MGLDSSVLVLNRLWQAVNVIHARRALALVYVGRGKAVDTDYAVYSWDLWAERSSRSLSGGYVTTTSGPIRVQYCGNRHAASELTLDHVQPRSRGGPTTWRNIVVSCFGCNSRKANRSPEEAGMPLLREPRAPLWHPTTLLRVAEEPHPLWQPFLGGIAG